MNKNDTNVITVVSGLPRSGTSLMMQVLEAAGLPILTDTRRRADDDNPRGYYELEKVKALARDASWVAEARGKVIKVISMLLYSLPGEHEYRVIFMTRRMEEILASQTAMLARLGQAQDGLPDDEMSRHYEKHLAKLRPWLEQQKNIKMLYCSYNDLLAGPRPVLEAVNHFLGGQLVIEKMLSAIDPMLYRQKK